MNSMFEMRPSHTRFVAGEEGGLVEVRMVR